MNFLSKIKSNRIASNSLWIIGERIFQLTLSLILSVLTARYLGPNDYGIISYMTSIVAFLSPIAMLGLDTILIKKLIDNPEYEGRYLGTSIVLRLLSSFICSIIATAFILLNNPDNATKLMIIILLTLQLIFQSFHIIDAWFQRYLLSKNTSIAKIVGALVVSIYRIYILSSSKSIVWFAFSNSLLSIVIAVVLLFIYYKSNTQKLKFEFKYILELLSESYHFIISGMMIVLYTQMDKIMIAELLNSEQVGYYSTAITLSGAWGFIPLSIVTSLQPSILEALPNKNLFISKLRKLYSINIWLCIIVSLIISIFAENIIILLYGKTYVESIMVLKIAVWFELFAVIGVTRNIWFIGENKSKYTKYCLAIGAFANLTLNFILIPTIGINGAAIATVITQFTNAIISPLLFKETRAHTNLVLKAFILK